MPEDQLKELCGEALYKKYEEFYSKKSLEADINFRWCPQRNCDGFSLRTVNNKLDCNKCFYEFCFLCAEPWHFEKPCSTVGDKSFLKWVSSKRVKKCPNCYMIIQKDGGCPHMSCSKCNYSWCWLCGKSFENHSEFGCMFGNTWMDLHLYPIFILMFYPVLLPFALVVVLLGVHIIDGGFFENLDDVPRALRFLIKYHIILYILAAAISPIIMGIALTFGIIAIGFSVSTTLAPYKHNQNIFWGLFLLVFVFSVAALVISLVLFLLVLSFAIVPVGGIVLLVTKILYNIHSIAFRQNN
jgi:IBR domain, a half RING-finger domain